MTAAIRLATEADAEAIQAIYAPYVRDTVISFELEPPDVETMRGRIRKTLDQFPWLVCAEDGFVLAYAYASQHRERPAYQWSADVSVYTRPSAQRRGIGRGLYTALLDLLRLQSYYGAFAGITLPNDASIGLHASMGFQHIGVYPNVGFKFGQWRSVAWMGLALQTPDPNPPVPSRLTDVLERPEAQAAIDAGNRLIRD